MARAFAYLLLTLSGPAAWWVLLQISDTIEWMTHAEDDGGTDRDDGQQDPQCRG
jgi:hypothetical protein